VGFQRVSLDKNRFSDFLGRFWARHTHCGVEGLPAARRLPLTAHFIQLFRDSQDPLLQAPTRRDRQRLLTAI